MSAYSSGAHSSPYDLSKFFACEIDELILLMLFCISELSFNFYILTATAVPEFCLCFVRDALRCSTSISWAFLACCEMIELLS